MAGRRSPSADTGLLYLSSRDAIRWRFRALVRSIRSRMLGYARLQIPPHLLVRSGFLLFLFFSSLVICVAGSFEKFCRFG